VQHDAHEFLIKLLDNLDRKLVQRGIEETFGSLHVGTIHQTSSSGESDRPFGEVTIPIHQGGTLPAAIEWLSRPEELGHTVRRSFFITLPPILIFHLARFTAAAKNCRRLAYPKHLDMTPYSAGADQFYELFAVVVHTGRADRGHYQLYSRIDEYDHFFLFNDLMVKAVQRDSDVLANNYGIQAAPPRSQSTLSEAKPAPVTRLSSDSSSETNRIRNRLSGLNQMFQFEVPLFCRKRTESGTDCLD
jgi:hypothetical protein